MRFLYIFPHPDDESFGPAGAMWHQYKNGHEIYLLTLTKGGATKQRHKYNYSIEQMGDIRYGEMQKVSEVLKLKGMKVWNMVDSGLKDADPREIQNSITDHIMEIKPDIIVTYPVHGISGFHDHLVTHSIVVRTFLDLPKGTQARRLAFFTVDKITAEKNKGHISLNPSTEEEIDCVISLTREDTKKIKESLGCYETYKEVIEKSDVLSTIGDKAFFEIYQRSFDPPITELEDSL